MCVGFYWLVYGVNLKKSEVWLVGGIFISTMRTLYLAVTTARHL